MPVIRNLKRRIRSIGGGLNVAKDVFWNLVTAIIRPRTGSANGLQNNSIVDSSTNNHTIVRYGNVSQGTFSPYGVNGGSMYFDGSGDYLSVAAHNGFDFGSENFTIEFWMNPGVVWTSQPSSAGIIACGTTSAAVGWNIYIDSNYTSSVNFRLAGINYFYSNTTPKQGVWQHWAFVRNGSTISIYVDGVLDKSTTTSTAVGSISTNALKVGQSNWGGAFNGYLSDVRIVKGTALYTSNFVPPSIPLSAITNTQFLLSGNNAAIKDYAGKNNGETIGNVQTSTTVKKFTETTMFFDGTGAMNSVAGGYLTIPHNGNFNLEALDFTIECWFYLRSITAGNYYTIISKRASSAATDHSFNIGIAGTEKYWVRYGNSSTTTVNADFSAGTMPTTNEWHHFALVRSGSSLNLYLDGIKQGATHNIGTTAIYSTTYPVYVGGSDPAAGYVFNGYIDDLRVTKGVARYTSDFAVDTQTSVDPYANQSISIVANGSGNDEYASNTTILCHFNNDSVNSVTGSAFSGSIGYSSTITRFGTHSANFTGSSYLDVSLNELPTMSSSSQFTIEGWLYVTGTHDWSTILGDYTGGITNYWSFGLNAARQLTFYVYTPTQVRITSSSSLPLNTWAHFAVSVDNGNVKYFIDGVSSGTSTLPLPAGSVGGRIGSYYGHNGGFYLDELRVTKGVARYSTGFTVPNNPYVLYSNNSTIVDVSSNNFPITKNGNVTQGTFSPFSNSGFSGYFDGVSDYVTIPSSSNFVLNGAFSIEGWIYLSTNIMDTQHPSILTFPNQPNKAQIYINSTNSFLSFYSDAADIIKTENSSITTNKWYHFAVCRDTSNNLSMFLDGKRTQTTTNSTVFGEATGSFKLMSWDGSGGDVNGYLSNFRILNGDTAYDPTLSSISVPTAPLDVIANTQLLIFNNSSLKDSSLNNLNVVGYGDVKIQAFSPFTTPTYDSNVHGGSIYFDGSGDYLSIPSSNLTQTGDLTTEMWIYFISMPSTGYQNICGQGAAGQSTYGLYSANAASNNWSTPHVLKLNVANVGDVLVGSTQLTTGTWYHIAHTRTSGVNRLFVNGILQNNTYTDSTSRGFNGNPFLIGNNSNCYISNFRYIVGTSLYTSTFTPPTAPLTPVDNTQLLLNGTNASVYDNSGKTVIELLGNAKVSTSVKKYSSSIAFDGASYAALSNINQFAFGTADFTIELWAYISGALSGDQYMFSMPVSGGVGHFGINIYQSTWRVGRFNDYYIGGTNNLPSLNTWTHIALTRKSGTLYLWVNGILSGSLAANIDITASGQPLLGKYALGAIYLNGNIEDFRVTKGIARYTAGFAVPTTTLGSVVKSLPITTYSPTVVDEAIGDPYYNQVVQHMHMNGVNGSTNYGDQKGRTVTTAGSAKLSTTQYKFGNASLYLANTSTDTPTFSATGTDFLFNTDFTIEMWVYVISGGDTSNWVISNGTTYLALNSSNTIFNIYLNSGTPTWSGGTVGLNQWQHLALVRTNGVVKFFVNGSQVGSDIVNTTVLGYTSPSLARFGGGNASARYIDEVRVTNGVARYTSNFTIPSAAFPDYQDFVKDTYLNQSLLLSGKSQIIQEPSLVSGGIKEESANLTVTNYNVSQQISGPFLGASSVYFSGNSGSYLTVQKIAAHDLYNTAFTIECWVKPNGSGWVVAGSLAPWGGSEADHRWQLNVSEGVSFGMAPNLNNNYLGTSSISMVNKWSHVAVTHDGTTLRIFVDGTLRASAAKSLQTWSPTGQLVHLGKQISSPIDGYFLGSISNFRIVTGQALYTSDFTPSTENLTAIPGTQMLIAGSTSVVLSTSLNNNVIADSTGKQLVVRNGNTAQGTFSPFSNSGWSIAVTDNASQVFYSTPSGSAGLTANIFDADFTVECWINWVNFTNPVAVLFGNCPQAYSDSVAWMIRHDRATVSDIDVLAPGIPTLGKWHHYALVRKGTTTRLWVDGVGGTPVTTITGTTRNPTLAQRTDLSGPAGLYLGRTSNNWTVGAAYGACYVSGVRSVKGSAVYDTAQNFITVPNSPPSNVAGTGVLCGSTRSFKDASNNSIAAPSFVGSPKIQAFSPFISAYNSVINGGSYYMDGTGDYLTVSDSSNLELGSGDFTIEWWANPTVTSGATYRNMVGKLSGTYGSFYFPLYNGNAYIFFSSSGSAWEAHGVNSGYMFGTPIANTWNHFAITRQSGVVRSYLNGIAGSTFTFSSALVDTTSPLAIGAQATGVEPYTGYITDVRIIKGQALYTTTFTPPTAPLTVVANTQLLLNGTNAAIFDVTGKAVIETVGTSTQLNNFNKMWVSSVNTTNVSSNYIKVNAPSIVSFGTTDFTVESWVKLNTYPTGTNAAYVMQTQTQQLYLGFYGTTGVVFTQGTQGPSVPLKTWFHIAWVRRNGTLYAYLNGVQVSSVAYSTNVTDTWFNTSDNAGTAGQCIEGQIEDLRVTKGVARYVSNFTVPLRELPKPK